MLGFGGFRWAPWEADSKIGVHTAGSRRSDLSNTLPVTEGAALGRGSSVL